MVKEYAISGDDFSLAGEASSSFKALLKKLGIPADTIRRVSIAMYEAEINTIVHGGGGNCIAEIESSRIKVTFTDHGPGISDISKAMQEGFSTASDKVRELGFGAGMGLPNIKKYTDDLIIDSKLGEGTTVTLIINL
ncbi:MAG: ATP-binding protein [Clostridia bacterium]|nr:ATP-binding protein [Clostridia bacterium]